MGEVFTNPKCNPPVILSEAGWVGVKRKNLKMR